MPQNLGLDEALVTINRTLVRDQLEFYYQTDECYGCPLERVKRLAGPNLDNVILSTKFPLNIELRETHAGNKTTPVACRLNNVELNNQGHYQIDVQKLGHSPADPLVCELKTLDKGDCSLCPLALLLCFLFAITAAEKLYAKFVSPRNNNKARRVNSGSSKRESAVEQQQQEATGEAGSDGQQHEPTTGDESRVDVNLNEQESPAAPKVRRLDSLDAFRGLTIAGMIMVNYGGAGYTILEHKPWDGITLADFVFPFFIFSMGASIALSTRSMMKREIPFVSILVGKILRRSAILMALGLCSNSKWLYQSNLSLSHLRLTGVLQRFSISYLVVATVYTVELIINKWIKAQSLFRVPILSSLIGNSIELFTALNFLGLYLWVTLRLEYSDTCPAGYLGPGGQTEGGRYANCTGGAAAWLDRVVLGESHLYNDLGLRQTFKTQVTHDPEGLLGFTMSILLTIIGLQCGKTLARFKSHRSRLLIFAEWIAFLVASGCLFAFAIPINKRLWSVTFVAATGACAFLIMILFYLLMDVYNCQRTFVLRLLQSAGKNSLFLYVAHSLLYGMLPWYFAVDESSHFQLLVRLTWATFVWLLVAHYMASKKLFIKI